MEWKYDKFLYCAQGLSSYCIQSLLQSSILYYFTRTTRCSHSLLGLTFLPSAFEIDQCLEKFQNPYFIYNIWWQTLCTVQEFVIFSFQFPFFYKISPWKNSIILLLCKKFHLKWSHEEFSHDHWLLKFISFWRGGAKLPLKYANKPSEGETGSSRQKIFVLLPKIGPQGGPLSWPSMLNPPNGLLKWTPRFGGP